MTEFEKQVYITVKKIPKGKTLTYKEVAQKINCPKAWQAVGNALSKNRNPKVPCHRVIRKNGEVGGYNRGIKKKKELLKKEGVVI